MRPGAVRGKLTCVEVSDLYLFVARSCWGDDRPSILPGHMAYGTIFLPEAGDGNIGVTPLECKDVMHLI